mmetsp:Transcript_40443/g.74888  ORF Transcript_40443/g.74888 Transcript_40443/m.74888 type:complete len:344 (-) Transcript_40443:14-1045(-)
MHAKFLAWCADRGISTPLTLQQSLLDPSYRYLSAPGSNPLPAGNTVVRAPLGACLIDDSLEGLAERLAREKSLGGESEFAPYVDILPELDSSTLQAMPRFWSDERLECVTDGGQLEMRVRDDERPRVDPWGLAIVNSRSNVLPGALFSVTPLLDMLNHDPTVGTSAHVTDKGELHLSVDQSFGAGEEVLISYDQLTNLDTLVNYGFVSDDNPFNAESVMIRTILGPPIPITVEADGSISSAALASLREILATPEERDGVQDAGKEGDNSSLLLFAVPVSDRNEEEVMALVGAALDDAMYEAGSGAKRAKEEADLLVSSYLEGRGQTLEKALRVIGTKFPDLGY